MRPGSLGGRRLERFEQRWSLQFEKRGAHTGVAGVGTHACASAESDADSVASRAP